MDLSASTLALTALGIDILPGFDTPSPTVAKRTPLPSVLGPVAGQPILYAYLADNLVGQHIPYQPLHLQALRRTGPVEHAADLIDEIEHLVAFPPVQYRIIRLPRNPLVIDRYGRPGIVVEEL